MNIVSRILLKVFIECKSFSPLSQIAPNKHNNEEFELQ